MRLFSLLFRPRRNVTNAGTKKRPAPGVTTARYGGMGESELQLRMERILENFISDRNYRVFESAQQLSAFSMSEQERFLKAAERLTQSSDNLAYQFCLNGITALTAMSEDEWDEWLEAVEARLRNENERAALDYLRNLDAHLQKIALPKHAVTLETITPVLERLTTALGGRRLAVLEGENTFTDTERIYLPKICSAFPDEKKNFAFYKATTVFLWAQTRFGTWRVDLPRLLYDAPDPDKATALFQALENLRLDACIERELPGVARLLAVFGRQSGRLPDHDGWRRAARRLAESGARAEDSLEMIVELYRAPAPQATIYQGTFKPLLVMRAMKERVAVERAQLQKELATLAEDLPAGTGKRGLFAFEVNRDEADEYRFELSAEGEKVEMTPEIRRLLESVTQDFGEVPEDYLSGGDAAEPADVRDERKPPQAEDSPVLLPEWDHSVQRYRGDWCRVFLRETPDGDLGFTARTLARHGGLVKQLRRTFEALRESNAIHKREPFGDDVNLDAAIESFISMQRGEEPNPRVYLRHTKTSRNVAVTFLVDMSGSTGGWINEIEKEALVLLCESLEMLGDRYAIYGFSGHTHERCDIFKIKSFAESYNDEVKKRIAGMAPQGYTRMGAAIRFACGELLGAEARTRVMITLSDGCPDDRDGYRGRYGIEDTRRALFETSFQGIHPYCITIDAEAADYLPYMYGRANFSIVDRVEKLPFQISDVYRRITT